MASCSNCRSELPADANFCPKCATPVAGRASIAPVDADTIIIPCPVCHENHTYSRQVSEAMNHRQTGGMQNRMMPSYETQAMSRGMQDRMMRPGRMRPEQVEMPGWRVFRCKKDGTPFKYPWPE
jgi:hypothetical protein